MAKNEQKMVKMSKKQLKLAINSKKEKLIVYRNALYRHFSI